jgi:hypothetical protein
MITARPPVSPPAARRSPAACGNAPSEATTTGPPRFPASSVTPGLPAYGRSGGERGHGQRIAAPMSSSRRAWPRVRLTVAEAMWKARRSWPAGLGHPGPGMPTTGTGCCWMTRATSPPSAEQPPASWRTMSGPRGWAGKPTGACTRTTSSTAPADSGIGSDPAAHRLNTSAARHRSGPRDEGHAARSGRSRHLCHPSVSLRVGAVRARGWLSVTCRRWPSYQDPLGSRVLPGGSWPSLPARSGPLAKRYRGEPWTLRISTRWVPRPKLATILERRWASRAWGRLSGKLRRVAVEIR